VADIQAANIIAFAWLDRKNLHASDGDGMILDYWIRQHVGLAGIFNFGFLILN
jgi:hypothetical protein